MAGNPLIAQGSLNRILGSVVWSALPALNITSPFLGRGGIGLALNGDATLILPTMTGTVQSEEPYMPVSLTVNLLRTQGLGAAYKLQMEDDSNLGDGVVRPDSKVLGNFPIFNCAIVSVREMNFGGQDPGFILTIGGYYLVNAAMWS